MLYLSLWAWRLLPQHLDLDSLLVKSNNWDFVKNNNKAKGKARGLPQKTWLQWVLLYYLCHLIHVYSGKLSYIFKKMTLVNGSKETWCAYVSKLKNMEDKECWKTFKWHDQIEDAGRHWNLNLWFLCVYIQALTQQGKKITIESRLSHTEQELIQRTGYF